jgi:hypothetical protein
MLLIACVGWVSFPLALYGMQKALGKGKRKALERGPAHQKIVSFSIDGLGMLKTFLSV